MRHNQLARRWCSVAGLLAPLLLLPFAVGCAERTAKVSGKVIYKDKPVPGGMVMFMPLKSGRNAATAILDEQGRYEVTVAVGDVKILVDNRELAPAGEKPPPPKLPGDLKLPPGMKVDPKAPDGGQRTGDQKAGGKYVEIPSKYYQFETTTLEYTVKAESQTHNIELK